MRQVDRLSTVVRIVAVRRDRLRRALEVATESLTKAQQRAAAAVARCGQAEAVAARAADDFRAQPQCPQRQLMRDVTADRVSAARDVCDEADAACDEAVARRHAVARAVAREDARADWLQELRRRARGARIERAAAREEDDRCTGLKAA